MLSLMPYRGVEETEGLKEVKEALNTAEVSVSIDDRHACYPVK